MLRLVDLGTDGLRRKLQEQQKAEIEGLALESFIGVEPGKIAAATRHGSPLPRKMRASARQLVDAQRHKHLIHAHVYASYDSPEVRSDIAKHVSVLKNLQRQVTNAVAVAYSRPPARVLRGVPEDQARAFAQAYRDAGTDSLAEQWNRQSFYLGVVHVLPRYEGDRLTWVTVLPDAADVLFDCETGETEPSVLIYETTSHGATRVAVDSERWWWLSDAWEVVHEEEHGMGMRPWVTFRWEEPPSFDYWHQGQCEDLYEATLEMGRLYAQMRWTRKNYSKKTETLHTGTNVKTPEGQNMGANQPVVFKGDGEVNFDVHDTIVSPDAFIAEMRELTESVLEAHGLPVNVVDFNTSGAQDASNTSAPANLNKHEALMKVRDKSVKMYDRAETELAVRAVAVLRRHGRMNLTDEQVRESLRVRFAPLSFADHPSARVKTTKEQMSIGQTNPYEAYMMENPGVTFEEAKEAVDQNVDLFAEFNKKLTAYNMSLDPDKGLMTAAQMNGKVGGVESGVIRSPDNAGSENE